MTRPVKVNLKRPETWPRGFQMDDGEGGRYLKAEWRNPHGPQCYDQYGCCDCASTWAQGDSAGYERGYATRNREVVEDLRRRVELIQLDIERSGLRVSQNEKARWGDDAAHLEQIAKTYETLADLEWALSAEARALLVADRKEPK